MIHICFLEIDDSMLGLAELQATGVLTVFKDKGHWSDSLPANDQWPMQVRQSPAQARDLSIKKRAS